MERREDGPVAPVTMNAFELISTSQGLNLGTLFEKQMVCWTSAVGLGCMISDVRKLGPNDLTSWKHLL